MLLGLNPAARRNTRSVWRTIFRHFNAFMPHSEHAHPRGRRIQPLRAFRRAWVGRLAPWILWETCSLGSLGVLHGSKAFKIASKLLQVGFLESIWAQLGAKLAPSWLKLGSCWAKLAQVGPMLAPKMASSENHPQKDMPYLLKTIHRMTCPTPQVGLKLAPCWLLVGSCWLHVGSC